MPVYQRLTNRLADRHMASLACMSFLAALGLGGCAETPAPTVQNTTPAFYRPLDAADARIDPVAARDMISIYRTNNRQAALTIDPALQSIAEAQAKAMAQAGAPNATVKGPLRQRLAGAQISRGVAVENVSAGYHTLAEAFSGWRQSGPHNAVMLNPKARRMGIATAYAPGSKYKVYWALVLTD
jgi:uncharacterized protein YkwD